MFKIPDWSLVKNPFYHLIRDGKILLITVGDSWTYGDSLGNTKVRNGIDDTDYRLQNVYGAVMSQVINSDWINLALPGISNYCMLNWLSELLKSKLEYEQINCVITLTESGRHEELRYITPKITLQKNLENIVQQTYQRIEDLRQKYPKINFIVGHNFTDRVLNKYNLVVPQSWLELLSEKSIQNNTHVVVSEHIEQMNYTHRYSDTPDIIERALARIDILDGCQYCNKEDTRHPNEQGHKIWANYLLGKL